MRKLLATVIAVTSSFVTAQCTPADEAAQPCDKWLTEIEVINGALIAAPRDCTYNISWTRPERCAIWGGTITALGCENIDPDLAVSIAIPGP